MLKMPTTVASRRGLGFLTTSAQSQPVVLTSHGKQVAVVLSPEEFDAQRRALAEAERRVLETVTNLVAERSTFRNADEVRELLRAKR